MKGKFVSLGVVIIVVAAGCGSTARRTEPTTTSPATTTTSPATITTSPATITTSPATTTVAPTTTVPPSGRVCREVGAARAPAPATYGEAAFDRFGPLEPAPSLTINVGHGDRIDAPLGVRASRIEGGVLVSASRAPNAPYAPAERLTVAAVNHDGTVRWSRCLDGNSEIQTVVAAPEYRPANALVVVLPALRSPDYRYHLVQLSLGTGAEQPTFAVALRSAGVDADGLARLGVADVTDRYALLADNVSVLGGAYKHIVRYDLVADVAVDVAVPTELQDPTPGPCGMRPQPFLSSSGDVIVTNDVIFGPYGYIEAGAVVARWHDGTWDRDPTILATAIGVRPSFACEASAVAQVLRGVDALGQVRWTDPDLTRPGAESIGFYLDGAVAVGQVCPSRDGDCSLDGMQLVGVDPTTGEVRWTQPGLRIVAGDPADGYVLVWAEYVGGENPPGWVLLDDRTGRSVPGQSWDDPTAFTTYPWTEVAGFNSTVRAGGLLLVVKDDQVRVWYPKGAGGEPRTVLLL